MDVGFHDGAIGAQLASFRYFELSGQLGQALVELRQGCRLNQCRPADEGRIIWNGLEVNSAELAQNQTIAYLVFSLLITQPIQPLDRQHAQDHFYRC